MIHLCFLYVIYLFGNWIQETFHLSIPGSVIGMLILFILLLTNIVKTKWVDTGASFIINHLALLFIPATVGLINFFGIFAGKGFFLFLITLFSTAIVMGGSGFISQWLLKRRELNNE